MSRLTVGGTINTVVKMIRFSHNSFIICLFNYDSVMSKRIPYGGTKSSNISSSNAVCFSSFSNSYNTADIWYGST